MLYRKGLFTKVAGEFKRLSRTVFSKEVVPFFREKLARCFRGWMVLFFRAFAFLIRAFVAPCHTQSLFGSTRKSVPPEGRPQFSSLTPRPLLADGKHARKGNANKKGKIKHDHDK